MKIWERLTVAALSVGWLVPAWLGIAIHLDFWEAEVFPRMRGESPLNNFPFIDGSRSCWLAALVWLAAVLFYWAYRLAGSGTLEGRRL